jgi:hypothetical protein
MFYTILNFILKIFLNAMLDLALRIVADLRAKGESKDKKIPEQKSGQTEQQPGQPEQKDKPADKKGDPKQPEQGKAPVSSPVPKPTPSKMSVVKGLEVRCFILSTLISLICMMSDLLWVKNTLIFS